MVVPAKRLFRRPVQSVSVTVWVIGSLEYVFSSNGRRRVSLHTLPAYPRRDTHTRVFLLHALTVMRYTQNTPFFKDSI